MTRTEAIEFCREHLPGWIDDGRLAFAPGYLVIDGERVHVLDITIPEAIEGPGLVVALGLALMVALDAAETVARLFGAGHDAGAAHCKALRDALDALREQMQQ